MFYNYKDTFSIVLMALSDADYKFIAVDICDYCSNSDSGVFGRSAFGSRLQSDTLNLPADQPINGSNARRLQASAVTDAFKAYFCSSSDALEWQR